MLFERQRFDKRLEVGLFVFGEFGVAAKLDEILGAVGRGCDAEKYRRLTISICSRELDVVALDAERSRGLAPEDAVREACLLRFRPILMTTLAAILGALPLAVGFGEGAELRRPLGIAIIGGLVASQVITLLTTPVVYLLLDKLRRRSPLERQLGRHNEPQTA